MLRSKNEAFEFYRAAYMLVVALAAEEADSEGGMGPIQQVRILADCAGTDAVKRLRGAETN